MNESDKQRISWWSGERGPIVIGSPVPMLGRVQIPKGIELGCAAVNVFGVNDPQLKGRDETQPDCESSAEKNFAA